MAKEEKTAYKYNVAWLSKKLDLQPASVRLALRDLNIATNKDGVYGWNELSKADAIREKIAKRSERAPAAASKKKSAKKTAKVAKKKSAKKKAPAPSNDE